MKKAKKILASILAFALIGVLVACGGGSDSDAAADSATETPSAVEPTDGVSDVENYELIVWHHEPPAHRVKAWNTVIDMFMAENPNISVTAEVVLWEDQQAKMLSAIQTGTAPDINAITETTWQSSYQAQGLVPVDDIIESIDAKEKLTESSKNGFYADDHYWAVPYACNVYSLMYRPSMLEAAGYDRPPETWSEMLEYAEKLTVDNDGDGTPDVYGIGIASGRNALTIDTFAAFLNSNGGEVYDENGNLDFDKESTVEALDFYAQLTQFSPPAASGWSWGEIEMNWAGGNLAMIPYHAPNLGAFFEAGDYDVATTYLPKPDGAEEFHTNFLNQALTVTKDAEERGNYPAVKKFIEFLMQPEVNWILTVCQEPGFFMPVTESAGDLLVSDYFDSENFPLEGFDNTPGSVHMLIMENFNEVAMESIKGAYALGLSHGAVNLNLAEIYNSLIISDMVQKVVLEGEPAADAVAWAQVQMEDIS